MVISKDEWYDDDLKFVWFCGGNSGAMCKGFMF